MVNCSQLKGVYLHNGMDTKGRIFLNLSRTAEFLTTHEQEGRMLSDGLNQGCSRCGVCVVLGYFQHHTLWCNLPKIITAPYLIFAVTCEKGNTVSETVPVWSPIYCFGFTAILYNNNNNNSLRAYTFYVLQDLKNLLIYSKNS